MVEALRVFGHVGFFFWLDETHGHTQKVKQVWSGPLQKRRSVITFDLKA